MSKARVYSYLRFSDPKQAAGSSADRQIEYARRWAAERQLALDDSLSLRDEGLSAYHQKHVKQGALGVFLSAVEDGTIPMGSVLIVEGLDRLSRAEPIQAQAQAQLAQIVNAGITVVTASDGKEYNRERLRAQPMDLVYSLLVMIRAHEESDTKSKRVKAAIRRQCQGWIAGSWRGIVRNGNDPAWVAPVDGKFELVPEREAAVRAAISMFNRGYGGVRIVRELTESGLQLTGQENGGQHLYKLLRNRALVGERVLTVDREEFVLKGYYPAILTEEEFAGLQHLASKRAGRAVRGTIPSVVTGTGITFCGYCGRPLASQNVTNRRRRPDNSLADGHRRVLCTSYAKDSGCPVGGSCSVAPIERAIMSFCADQMNLTRLLDGDNGASVIAGKLSVARLKVTDIEAQIRRITDALLSDDGEAPAAFMRRARELEESLADKQKDVAARESELVVASSTATPAAAEAWAALAEGVMNIDHEARVQARQLVVDTFSRITVFHRGFRPDDEDGSSIGTQLIAKHGNMRLLNVDRRSGRWRAAEDVNVAALGFTA
ncbi:recombinase family protein [Ralstonia nicotianae]